MFDAKYVATASKALLLLLLLLLIHTMIVSMASIVNWGCNFLVGIAFPYMQVYYSTYCN
jgi:hypothetical protein